jgi:hypothetical protein
VDKEFLGQEFLGTAATLVAVFGWMVLYFWSTIFTSYDTNSPYSQGIRMFNSINPNIALSLALRILAQYETQGIYYNFDNLLKNPDLLEVVHKKFWSSFPGETQSIGFQKVILF